MSGRLWLPLSLIEIGFRNAVDGVVCDAHSAGKAWMCEGAESEADVADWGTVTGRKVLCSAPGENGNEDEEDDNPRDPVAAASRSAALHNPEGVTRDDLVAHLMLGFWVFRAPNRLLSAAPALDVYSLLTEKYEGVFGTSKTFRGRMSQILDTRNRVAHHEPVLLRSHHIFHKKTGAAYAGNELVTSLQGATEKFLGLRDKIIDTALQMAPVATQELEELRTQIATDLEPLQTLLHERYEENKKAREIRKAERREGWEREQAAAERGPETDDGMTSAS